MTPEQLVNVSTTILRAPDVVFSDAQYRGCISDLVARVQELENREADHHDIIARLWAVTDPELAGEMQELIPRIHRVLGVDDVEGHCGNPVCARIAELERESTRLSELLYLAIEDYNNERERKRDAE